MTLDHVRIKVLKPLRQGNGMTRYPGEMIAIPKELAEEFIAVGAAEKCAPMAEEKPTATK